MLVVKFGGSSIGNAGRMDHVADIICSEETKRIVVLSAISGTTNTLYEISSACNTNRTLVSEYINKLHFKYKEYVNELLPDSLEANDLLNDWLKELENLTNEEYSQDLQNKIVAMGEFFSTSLFLLLLTSRGVRTKLLDAPDLIQLNKYGEPEIGSIKTKLEPLIVDKDMQIWLTQGFICKNHNGLIDNLKRGGSDYTASLLGAAINADEIQIWTDIDGLHNNDPRVVDNTVPIARLSFNEAAELAYFGAKILHPATILPAKRFEVNVRIKNTLSPEAEGTLITRIKRPKEAMVKAVAAKDKITAIKIRSSRMLMAYGFLLKVFEVFEKYKTPIDMITTSEVAVSLTIDTSDHLNEIISELESFGEVEVDYDQTIICIVGNMVSEDKGLVSTIFNSLETIPIRMISYGGSRNNISLLVSSVHKADTLKALNTGLFKL